MTDAQKREVLALIFWLHRKLWNFHLQTIADGFQDWIQSQLPALTETKWDFSVWPRQEKSTVLVLHTHTHTKAFLHTPGTLGGPSQLYRYVSVFSVQSGRLQQVDVLCNLSSVHVSQCACGAGGHVPVSMLSRSSVSVGVSLEFTSGKLLLLLFNGWNFGVDGFMVPNIVLYTLWNES